MGFPRIHLNTLPSPYVIMHQAFNILFFPQWQHANHAWRQSGHRKRRKYRNTTYQIKDIVKLRGLAQSMWIHSDSRITLVLTAVGANFLHNSWNVYERQNKITIMEKYYTSWAFFIYTYLINLYRKCQYKFNNLSVSLELCSELDSPSNKQTI